jgi:SAM-dependent methyltransferase
MTDPTLEFTGERFTPECVREIWYEHWHRYAFALALAPGRRVLDAACGEGYGSALLATRAASVLGADISEHAIAHARERYGAAPNLDFAVADCTALEGLPARSFDLIVSFETLEHVAAQERMLDRFAELLAPEGVLLISTPDKRTYSDLAGFHNEHHVRELYRPEFEAMLDARFAAKRLYAQKLLFQSVLWELGGSQSNHGLATVRADGSVETGLGYAPLYYVAACAQGGKALQGLAGLSLFGDAAESVYHHYNDEIRRHIAAGLRLAELERELELERARCRELQARLDPSPDSP